MSYEKDVINFGKEEADRMRANQPPKPKSQLELDHILRMQQLECTGEVARAGWVLDQDEILAAMEKLGIECKVRIRFMTGRYTRGTHRNGLDKHYITLDQNRNVFDTNLTLWHELAHAMQAERFAKETGKPMTMFHQAYKYAKGEYGNGYHGNLYEVEANKIAADNHEIRLVAYEA